MTERQMSAKTESLVQKVWYGSSIISRVLAPVSMLYAAVIFVRRQLYAKGIFRICEMAVPVIVVGNITVGGTGKTPVTLWLARKLAAKGMSPGIVTRGYRGSVGASPVHVTNETGVDIVGDEAILLARRSGCPVVVHPDRVAAVDKLIQLGVNIVISDDGLQHYRLARSVEIAVIDGERGFGNGRLLPSGPLREPIARLESVNEVLIQGTAAGDAVKTLPDLSQPPRYFQLRPLSLNRLDEAETRQIEDFSARRMHAIAGIGNPERFFAMLETFGIEVLRHPLADHANITQKDLTFSDQAEVVMTEKDAVKCIGLNTSNCWYVPAELTIGIADEEALMQTIENKALIDTGPFGDEKP